MAEAGEFGCSAHADDSKMCKRCFGLFQQATQMIMSAHASEQRLLFKTVEDINTAMDWLLRLIEPKTKAHNSLVNEIKTTLQESIIMKKSYAGLKMMLNKLDSNVSEPIENKLAEITPQPISHNDNDSRGVVNLENEDERDLTQLLKPDDLDIDISPLNIRIFSRENSLEDKVFAASIRNMYETASFSKTQGFNSEKKFSVAHEGLSDIDKKIKELEEEKCREEEGKFVAQLPGTYSILTKKHSSPIEGKSVEENTTIGTPANQMSINFAQDLKCSKQISEDKSHIIRIEVPVWKTTKTSDLKSLVYKVSSRVFEFEKFDRKKSRIGLKDCKENMKTESKKHAKTISDTGITSPVSTKIQPANPGVNFDRRRLTSTPKKIGYSLRGGENASKV